MAVIEGGEGETHTSFAQVLAWDFEQAPTEPPELLFGDDGDLAPPEIEPVPYDPLEVHGKPDPVPQADVTTAELAPLDRGELQGVPEEGTKTDGVLGGPARALKIINGYTPELIITTETPLPENLFLPGISHGIDLTFIQQVRTLPAVAGLSAPQVSRPRASCGRDGELLSTPVQIPSGDREILLLRECAWVHNVMMKHVPSTCRALKVRGDTMNDPRKALGWLVPAPRHVASQGSRATLPFPAPRALQHNVSETLKQAHEYQQKLEGVHKGLNECLNIVYSDAYRRAPT